MEDYDSLTRSIVGEETETIVRIFPSGSVTLDIRFGERSAVIAGSPETLEWGVSTDSTPGRDFAGYEHVTASVEDALAIVREAFRGRTGR